MRLATPAPACEAHDDERPRPSGGRHGLRAYDAGRAAADRCADRSGAGVGLDHALLIVGHANTVPELLVKLGAKPDCFQRLGITGQAGSLMTESYDGLWRVDLKKQGCEAIERETMTAGK